MLGELYKMLAEEPGKLTRLSIRAFELVLITITTEALYRYFFGNYYIIQLNDFEALANFIFSGRILIVAACFGVAKLVILPVFSGLLLLIAVKFFGRKKWFKLEQKEVTYALKFLQVVEFGDNSKHPTPGKNFDLLYEFTDSFRDNQDSIGIYSLKNSLITEILTQLMISMLLYYFFFYSSFPSIFFVAISFLAFVLLFATYLMLNELTDYMNEHSEEIILALDFVRHKFIITKELKKYRSELFKSDQNLGKEMHFEYLDRKYAIVFPHDTILRDKRTEADYIQHAKNCGIHYFIFIPEGITPALPLDTSASSQFTIIQFTDYKDLESKFRLQLRKKLSF